MGPCGVMQKGSDVRIYILSDVPVSPNLAAGDVRVNSIRQVISAAGDGATAAIFAEKYIVDKFKH